MADYWKSNDRKYCDFCKCWLSDNKASISFHENGKRHKMNVEKRISEISRSSAKAEKERNDMEAELRKMEKAAMASYAQDIHANADFTSRSINAVMKATTAAGAHVGPTIGPNLPRDGPSSSRTRQVDPLRLPGNSDDEDEGGRHAAAAVAKVDPSKVPEPSLWVEGRTDEGYTYYWNVKTNESVWTKPKEGYLSYEEYERINELALKQQELQEAEEAKKFRENVDEEVARYNRERLKYVRRPDPKEVREALKAEVERKQSYKTEEEAAAPVLGAWQTVEHKPPPEPVDLELPVVQHNYYAPPADAKQVEEPPVKRFKEKTLGSLDPELAIGTASTFKKRKFAAKGNARQRLAED